VRAVRSSIALGPAAAGWPVADFLAFFVGRAEDDMVIVASFGLLGSFEAYRTTTSRVGCLIRPQ